MKTRYDKSLVIFDLDGTITESKSDLTEEMSDVLCNLLDNKKVAIISGCAFEQFTNQFLTPFRRFCNPSNEVWNSLWLLPTSGSQLYRYDGEKFIRVYHNDLTLKEKTQIYNAWESSTLPKDFKCDCYGEVAEDRGSQVTFSMCGQNAPLEIKKSYDPDVSIRRSIVAAMKTYLPSGFEIRIGGTTSIDVTRSGIDKEYGVNKLLAWLNMTPEDAIFIGDALYKGGNDSEVRKTGVECIEVSGPHETINIIKEISNG